MAETEAKHPEAPTAATPAVVEPAKKADANEVDTVVVTAHREKSKTGVGERIADGLHGAFNGAVGATFGAVGDAVGSARHIPRDLVHAANGQPIELLLDVASVAGGVHAIVDPVGSAINGGVVSGVVAASRPANHPQAQAPRPSELADAAPAPQAPSPLFAEASFAPTQTAQSNTPAPPTQTVEQQPAPVQVASNDTVSYEWTSAPIFGGTGGGKRRGGALGAL